jgi:hypothetical protein
MKAARNLLLHFYSRGLRREAERQTQKKPFRSGVRRSERENI